MPSPIAVTRESAFTGHADVVYTVAGLGPDHFVTAGGEGVVARWAPGAPDTALGLVRTPAPIYSLLHLPWRQALAIGQNDGGLRLLPLTTGAEAEALRSAQVHTAGVFDLAAVPALDLLVAAGGDGQLSLWQGQPLACVLTARVSTQPLRALALSPDGATLAVGGSDGHIRLYTTRSLEPLAQWPAHASTVFCLSFTPDGLGLLSGGRDAHLKVWRLADQALAHDVVAHLFAIHHLAWAPGGHWLATGSIDKTLKLWLPPTAQAPPRLLKVVDLLRHGGHRSSVNRLHWLDAQRVISVSDDRQVLQWRFDWVGAN